MERVQISNVQPPSLLQTSCATFSLIIVRNWNKICVNWQTGAKKKRNSLEPLNTCRWNQTIGVTNPQTELTFNSCTNYQTFSYRPSFISRWTPHRNSNIPAPTAAALLAKGLNRRRRHRRHKRFSHQLSTDAEELYPITYWPGADCVSAHSLYFLRRRSCEMTRPVMRPRPGQHLWRMPRLINESAVTSGWWSGWQRSWWRGGGRRKGISILPSHFDLEQRRLFSFFANAWQPQPKVIRSEPKKSIIWSRLYLLY